MSVSTQMVEGKPRILVVDDDRSSRQILVTWLEKNDFEVVVAVDGQDAMSYLYDGISLVITDMQMPKMDGLELLKIARQKIPHAPVIVLTGEATVDSAIEAMSLGAQDYLRKPVNLEELLVRVQRAIEQQRLSVEISDLHTRLKEKDELYNMIGRCDAMRQIFERIRLTADSEATVLVTGESGTGKELVARALHAHSPRAKNPYLPVNFAALSESLIESELFGHEAGAFTGANKQRKGVFQAAEGGTLFLDEIGELQLGLQSKLLRALENRTVIKVGGQKEEHFDVRLVAATNCNLLQQVEEGKFREDLYYRLNVIPIELPPLRDRRDDIPLLAQFFAESISSRSNRGPKLFSVDALQRLCTYDWPGNVRELRNTVERMIVLSLKDEIQVSDLPANILGYKTDNSRLPDSGMTLQQMEKEAITNTLAKLDGRRKDTADQLGISVRTLQRKIREYNLQDDKSPKEPETIQSS